MSNEIRSPPLLLPEPDVAGDALDGGFQLICCGRAAGDDDFRPAGQFVSGVSPNRSLYSESMIV